MSQRWLAGIFLGVGAVLLSAPLWPPLWAGHVQAALSREASSTTLRRLGTTLAQSHARGATPAPLGPLPKAGQVVALLQIPAITVNAAVVAGTSEQALAGAPGWVMSTAVPGQSGTAVIAAHNVTFFRHLNQLHSGERFTVVTGAGRFIFAVTGHAVVRTGAVIPNTAHPTIVLEACYPLNALYLTPDRYLIYARLISSVVAPHELPSPSSEWPYQAAVPAAVAVRFPLALSQNHLPMGSLTYQAPSTAGVLRFESSALPYDVIAESLRLVFASIDLARIRDVALYQQMLTQPGPLPPFWGATIVPSGPADVTITLAKSGAPTQVSISLGVIASPTGPRRLRMTAAISGHTVTLSGFQETPAG